MITYQLSSHVFLTHVLTLVVEDLGSLATPADPPSTNFLPLFSTKTLQKWSPNDQNTPCGFPNISNFCTSYFPSYISLLHLELLELDK